MRTTRKGFLAVVLGALLWSLAACADREAPSASAPATEAGKATTPAITYASQPDPPRAGDNAVSVVVRDINGTPMPGLDVKVTYFMPAMPSMNMPEMRDSFPLAHMGGGRYAGTVRLSMGGTWVVTVTAMRGEETLLRKNLNIVARE